MDLENAISEMVEFKVNPNVVITISIRGLDINKPKVVIERLVFGEVRETLQIFNKKEYDYILAVLNKMSNAIFTNK